jgi:hypothetical protein
MEDRTNKAFMSRLLQVSVGQYYGTVLPSELHQARFKILSAGTSNHLAHFDASGKIDLLDRQVPNDGIRNCCTV